MVTKPKWDHLEIGLNGLLVFPGKIPVEWQGIIILDKNFFVVRLTEILQTILSEGVCKCRKLSGLGGVRSQKLSGSRAVLPVSHSPALPLCLPSSSLFLYLSLLTPLSSLRNMWSSICMAALSLSLSRSWVFVYMYTGQSLPYISQVHSFKV